MWQAFTQSWQVLPITVISYYPEHHLVAIMRYFSDCGISEKKNTLWPLLLEKVMWQVMKRVSAGLYDVIVHKQEAFYISLNPRLTTCKWLLRGPYTPIV